MLSHLAILFPCITSGLWFLVFLARFTRSTKYMYLTFLSGLTALFFFVDACYIMPDVSTRTLVIADTLKQFTAPTMGLFCWQYFRALKKDKKPHMLLGYLIVVPTILMAISGLSYAIMGLSEADAFIRAYAAAGEFPSGFDEPVFIINKVVNYDIYNILEIGVVSFLIIYLIRDLVQTKFRFKELSDAIVKGIQVSVHHIQCIYFLLFLVLFIAKVILGRSYLLHHQSTALLLATIMGFIILLICSAALTDDSEPATLKAIYSGNSLGDSSNSKTTESYPSTGHDEDPDDESEEIPEDEEDYDDTSDLEEEDTEDEYSQNVPYHTSTIKYDESLVEKFRVAVVEKKLYLRNGLTIKDVCEELGSNKTYISKMVNERFGMPFPNFINMLRVDYAKQYLLEHPDAKQEEVADECGFPNAAGFNRSFKKETGTTPRIWLAKNK